MKIVLLDEQRVAEWTRHVRDAHHATLAHELQWRNAVEKTYRHTPYYLMAVEADTVAGLLPLFLIRSPFFGRYLVTAPYLSYGGLLAEDERAARALVEAARTLTLEKRAAYVEIRGLDKVDQGFHLQDRYCTYLLPLESDAEAVWRRLEKRARTAVRKAVKCELTVERGPHLVSAFAKVSNQVFRDLGTPSHADAFYRHILAEWGDRAEVFMVRHRDRFIGGGLTVTCRTSLAWLYGGCVKGYRDMAAMNLLTWEIIRYACAQGLGTLDFGRSRWDSGTALFKRQWGAQPCALFYEFYAPEGGRMPDLDPTNPKFHLAIEMWKRLPLSIAKTLGPYVIRGLA